MFKRHFSDMTKQEKRQVRDHLASVYLLKAREQEVTSVGGMLYETIKTCTGLDLHELLRRLIKEKRAKSGF